ncbi:NDUFA5 [Branchiostoma lanceolatum]|uniref:NADH dehydrogenase [ubiquinone] 1 alpha subcomplex subunit 5 n=1 Tax=Branchiostoma lanceolatum TaxID=7740 RepID=A0A8K0A1T9_BRALA|nr:NDUFA5 [Branchiostoma lanceolatum]
MAGLVRTVGRRFFSAKATTGLTGMGVAKDPHLALRVLYTKTLAALEKLPKDAAYRRHTEGIINDRFELVKTVPDVTELEKKINCGQIEQVIIQAEGELSLARKMADWKAWEPLVSEPPEGQWKWP